MGSTGETERRLVTILFADLVGSTALGESLDPEQAEEVISAVHQAMAGAIEAYGGYVLKYLGDGMMALFGAPVAREDDAERAVVAALAMHAALQDAGDGIPGISPTLALRIGITSGEVIAGVLTGGYDVSGDAANTSARLQGAAEVGGVLVGEETMRLARRAVRFGERQVLALKGKAEPVVAYPVLGLRDRPVQRWEGQERRTPLVGRDAELARLRSAWRGTLTGHGMLITLVGEAGVGKSRLLSEAVAAIAEDGGNRVLWGRCASYGGAGSLGLIADLLRGLCGLAPVAPDSQIRERLDAMLDRFLDGQDAETRAMARDVLGTVLGLPPGDSGVAGADARIRRQVLVRCLLLLTGGAAHAPALLVLEDLHWLDEASAEVLAELLHDVRALPLLVLATQRPDAVLPWGDWDWPLRLALEPLAADDAQALARAILGADPAADLLAHLDTRAGGNPFFLEELIRSLHESGALVEDGGEVHLAPGAAARLPSTLTELLLARLDRLEAQTRQVAQVASVIGRSFAVSLLAALAGQPEQQLTSSLHALERADIAFPLWSAELEYLFKHATVQETAYSTLLVRRRQSLHAQIARLIADLYPGEDQAEVIAYHFARSRETGAAAHWLERAGDRAMRMGANLAAIDHYTAARSHLEHLSTSLPAVEYQAAHARLDEKLGDVRLIIDDYAEARALFAHTRAHQTDPIHRAELWRKEGETWERLGEYSQALACYAAAEEENPASPDGLPAVLSAELATGRARVYRRQSDHAAAQAAAAAALTLLDGEPEGTPLANALAVMGVLARDRNEHDRAEQCFSRCLAIYERLGDQEGIGNTWSNLGVIAHKRADFARSERCHRRALAIREHIGDRQGVAMSWNNLGNWARSQGRMGEAAEFYRRSLAIKDRIGDQHGAATTLFNMGAVDFARGDLAVAESCFAQALEINRRLGDQQGVADCIYNLAEIAMVRGDYALAREQHLQSLAIVERLDDQVGLMYAWNNLGHLACECGDLHTAASYFRRARRGTRRLDDVALEGYAALGLAGVYLRRAEDGAPGLRAAAALLRRARAIADGHDLLELALRVGLSEAELHVLRGEVEPARAAVLVTADLAGAGEHRLEAAFACRLLGRIALAAGDTTAASTQLAAARTAFEAIGAEVESARTRRLQADVLAHDAALAGAAPPPAARALLVEARDVFAARGAERDRRQVDQRLDALHGA